MSEYGLMINYEYCTGCHTCEVACKLVQHLPSGAYGIKILQDGPRQNPDGSWEYNYLPVLTSLCDLCEDRVKEGRLPNCVHHCQSGCMYYDTLEELAKLAADKPKSAIFRATVPGAEPFIDKEKIAAAAEKKSRSVVDVVDYSKSERAAAEAAAAAAAAAEKIVPQTEVNKAWDRAGGCCECESDGHDHDGERCNHRCIYMMQGGANEAGWEAVVIDENAPLTAENCKIMCRKCVTKMIK